MLFITGLLGYHMVLIITNQTTKEELKNTFKKSFPYNPYQKKNFCNNWILIFCNKRIPIKSTFDILKESNSLIPIPKQKVYTKNYLNSKSEKTNDIKTSDNANEDYKLENDINKYNKNDEELEKKPTSENLDNNENGIRQKIEGSSESHNNGNNNIRNIQHGENINQEDIMERKIKYNLKEEQQKNDNESEEQNDNEEDNNDKNYNYSKDNYYSSNQHLNYNNAVPTNNLGINNYKIYKQVPKDKIQDDNTLNTNSDYINKENEINEVELNNKQPYYNIENANKINHIYEDNLKKYGNPEIDWDLYDKPLSLEDIKLKYQNQNELNNNHDIKSVSENEDKDIDESSHNENNNNKIYCSEEVKDSTMAVKEEDKE